MSPLLLVFPLCHRVCGDYLERRFGHTEGRLEVGGNGLMETRPRAAWVNPACLRVLGL